MNTKDIKDINLVIQARLNSERCPQKMVRSTSVGSLLDIAIQKAIECKIPNNQITISVNEKELVEIAKKYDVGIYRRSERSANSEGGNIKEIFEWWEYLPGKFVVMFNACCPFLTVETINRFVDEYLSSEKPGAFGVIAKKNYFWEKVDDQYKSLNTAKNKHNTKLIEPVYEAAHVLYAGSFNDIEYGVWMGNMKTLEDVLLVEIPEEECFDIDHEWQFERFKKIID